MQLYTYCLKIINPNKKSDFIIRDIHHFGGKFATILDMKKKMNSKTSYPTPLILGWDTSMESSLLSIGL